MSREYILWIMQHDKPREMVCYDSSYNYYNIGVAGFPLMFRRNRLRPDGRRSYFLTDDLAMALNYRGLYEMKYILPSLQYWRRFVSVERLRVAYRKYESKWGEVKINGQGVSPEDDTII